MDMFGPPVHAHSGRRNQRQNRSRLVRRFCEVAFGEKAIQMEWPIRSEALALKTLIINTFSTPLIV